MSLPIVIAHTGYHPYLEFTLRHAHDRAGDHRFIFLGDRTNDRFPFLQFVDGSEPVYERAAAEVAAVYRHMSTNTAQFELSAFQRWFRIRALMEQEGLDEALVLDSDVLLYGSADEIAGTWADGCAIALATPEDQRNYRWESSGHSAYWTREQLQRCCAYVTEMYTDPAERAKIEEKWAFHLETGTPGGICDMTAFYLFAERQEAGVVRNVSDVRGGTTFDHNAGLSLNLVEDEYALEGGAKAVTFEAGQPIAHNRRLDRPVRFLSLHLQGPTKGHAGAFYQGPDFEGREALARKLRAYYGTRKLAGQAKYALWTGFRKALRHARPTP
jgi:hypothetical protein